MSQWVGQAINVECYDLGVFQGLVESIDADTSTVTLKNAFKDGRPCEHKSVSILSSTIKDLNFIENRTILHNVEKYNNRVESSDDDRAPPRHKVDKRKPAKVMRAKTLTEEDYSAATTNHQRRRSSSCSISEQNPHHNHGSPKIHDQARRHGNHRSQQNSRNDCFGVSVESCVGEFDFEKNLAMFDKQRVFDEIENGGKNRLTPKKGPEQFKHDEMVLKTNKAVRQIKMVNEDPSQSSLTYTTDDGLVIPCIKLEMRERLFEVAATHGFTEQRRVDIVGRNISDMIFQLIGGSSRLNPQNTHQTPTVVLFCGAHVQGSYGLNSARHLANHNVKTVVFTPSSASDQVSPTHSQELTLYDLTGNKRITQHKDLATGTIDLIVNCLDSHYTDLSEEPWYKYVTNWCSTSRAHVLAIDPPCRGCAMETKWSVHIGLPQELPRSAGQTYLCDVAIPKQIFSHIGVKYRSPFGTKFCIPLHSQ